MNESLHHTGKPKVEVPEFVRKMRTQVEQRHFVDSIKNKLYLAVLADTHDKEPVERSTKYMEEQWSKNGSPGKRNRGTTPNQR